MKKNEFDGLMKSLGQASEFARSQPPRGTRVHVPDIINVAAIRAKANLTQEAFAAQIGVSVGTLRNWEQNRRLPEGPARVLLALLAKDPKLVSRILSKAA